ncbi:MAG: RnfABCDGE type electron transport complex subunit B [Chromatiales bacterium]|nr:RnfABCDGE type electron transport complex subunit B [Chromatiales bacterium]
MTSVEQILVAASFMGGLGLLLAAMLAYANRRLFVYEDPRIDEVDEMLPHSNCGACGTPGCRPFAEMLIEGTVTPGQCTVNSADMNVAIADYLGVDVGGEEKQVARLACAGGSHVAYTRARYEGLKTCRAAALVSGGGKGCTWACLGLGDCDVSCDFDAIHMDPYGLPVVDVDKCTACGDCVEACPKMLFSLQPVGHRLWLACKSLDSADMAEADCEVTCNACGRCSADSPEGLITIKNNLAVIDYSKNELASRLAIERCPTGAIVWLDEVKGVLKGVGAKKVIRREPLPRG